MINIEDYQDTFNVCEEWFEHANDLCLDILLGIVQKYFTIADDEDRFNTMMELVANYHIFLVAKNTALFRILQPQFYDYYLDCDSIPMKDCLHNCVVVAF